jgi:hypothetical protein
MKRLSVTWICQDCAELDTEELSFIDLPKSYEKIKSELRIYRPQFCPACFGDEFGLLDWEEIEAKYP